MKPNEFIKAFQATHDGQSFANITEIAKFVGKDRHKIGTLLYGIPKFGQNYFIGDVAEIIVREMK